MVATNFEEQDIRELEKIVDTYPWFSIARKALVEKMSCMGEDYMDQALNESALFFYSRSELARSAKAAIKKDRDRQAAEVARQNQGKVGTSAAANASGMTLQERARAAGYILVGGDYFSHDEIAEEEKAAGGKDFYDRFHESEGSSDENDAVGDAPDSAQMSDIEEICTETLANIYAKQDLTSQAIEIYNKLILLYPEKSAYFATLIKDLKNKNV
jgi:hypothetical protein